MSDSETGSKDSPDLRSDREALDADVSGAPPFEDLPPVADYEVRPRTADGTPLPHAPHDSRFEEERGDASVSDASVSADPVAEATESASVHALEGDPSEGDLPEGAPSEGALARSGSESLESAHALPERSGAGGPGDGAAVSPSAAAEAPPASVSLGERLRQARLDQRLSEHDVAMLLKVPARKVAAMESERWDELPEAPYARGFLRNYAKLLRLDPNSLIAEIDTHLGVPQSASLDLPQTLATPFPARAAGGHDAAVSRRMVWVAAVCAVVAAGIFWSGTSSFQRLEARLEPYLSGSDHPTASTRAEPSGPRVEDGPGNDQSGAAGAPQSPETAPGSAAVPAPAPATAPLAPAPAGGAPAAAQASAAHGASGALPTVAQSSPGRSANTVLAAAAPVNAAPTPAHSDAEALVMNFHDDSWIEVRQADGKLLASGMIRPGEEKVFPAAPPLEVVIGNAPGVAVSYRGTPVNLAPYTHDRVAHLTLK